ncbi:MAG: hypothetical protein ACT4N2_06355 [Hyphomicrobium sp.]
MSARRRILGVVLLLWLAGALALLNTRLADMPIDISPLASEADPADRASGPALTQPGLASQLKPLSDYRETVSRPLFQPTRRPVVPSPNTEEDLPPAPASEQTEIIPAAPSGLSLVGLMGSGGSRRALLRPNGQSHGTWLTVGRDIDGWRLSRIEENHVLIEKDGSKEELFLHQSSKP